MTPDTAVSHGPDQVPVSELFADLDAEFAGTRRILERYPDDQDPTWAPHEKSMGLLQLAAHVASLPEFARVIASEPEWNAADAPYVPPAATNRAELLDLFDGKVEAARAAITSLGADDLQANWRMRNGEIVYFEGKRGVLLRRFLVSHTAHHRGQLTVYYRMLGVPVPGLYGPSADDRRG
ncbi:MAG: hypothetical protein EA350_13565 [Gemmatimonadales bacterium]|nr:MAG: hypothetical protein EA350_13565 [Gemmatimonadales bacterium]